MRRASVLLVLVIACGKRSGPTNEPEIAAESALPAVPGECSGVRFELAAHMRDGAWYFEGTLVHEGTTPLTLVSPGDGSDIGRRIPWMKWQSTTLGGTRAEEVDGARCGNMNAMKESEIFVLQPGERRKLEWVTGPQLAPGSYYTRVTYENDPSTSTLGTSKTELVPKLRATNKCRVTSNPVRIVVPGHPS